jgi:hypothetical protein
VLLMNRRLDEASAVGAGFSPETRRSVPGRVSAFLLRAATGRKKAAASLDADTEAVASASDVFARFLAQGHALAGETAQALRWLRIAVDRGFINYPFLARHDPSLASLRGDPRFAALLGDVRQRWERFET